MLDAGRDTGACRDVIKSSFANKVRHNKATKAALVAEGFAEIRAAQDKARTALSNAILDSEKTI